MAEALLWSFSTFIPVIATSVNTSTQGFAFLCSTNNNHLFPFPCIAYHTDHRHKTMRTTASDSSTLAPLRVHFLYNTWPSETHQLNKVWSNLDSASHSIRIICGVVFQTRRRRTRLLVGDRAQSTSVCLVISKLPPKETHIAFYISEVITLQYVAVVLCQEKSRSFLLASSQAGLHAAPV